MIPTYQTTIDCTVRILDEFTQNINESRDLFLPLKERSAIVLSQDKSIADAYLSLFEYGVWYNNADTFENEVQSGAIKKMNLKSLVLVSDVNIPADANGRYIGPNFKHEGITVAKHIRAGLTNFIEENLPMILYSAMHNFEEKNAIKNLSGIVIYIYPPFSIRPQKDAIQKMLLKKSEQVFKDNYEKLNDTATRLTRAYSRVLEEK